jgi:hypothetical protein
LDSGRPVGEALSRLQELGAISGETRGEIEKLQKEGKKGKEVWSVAEQALSRFSGSMEKQSATWNGKISTLKDNINLAFAALGQPINESLKGYLDDLAGIDFSSMAANLGESLADGLQIISDGKIWELFALYAEQAISKVYDMSGGKLAVATSSITQTIAAGFNALMDDSGQSFDDAFNKYADAGVEENLTAGSEIQDRINEILASARTTRSDRAIRNSLGPGTGATIDAPEPPKWLTDGFFDNPAFDMTKGITIDESDSGNKSLWEESSASVNEMQARGLAQGGVFDKSGRDQVSLLTTIRDTLKKIETGGLGTWA